MAYYIDLSKITLQEYSRKLENGYLPPSRKILLLDIKTHFNKIESLGIGNVEDLRNALKTKKKLEEFSIESGISKDYLVILIREINCSLPKPNKIKDFPELEIGVAEKLEGLGIKHTFHLYPRIREKVERKKLALETGIEEKIILKLAKLTDLSRVKWVNHTFAFMLYETTYQTVKSLAKADAVKLHKAIADLNNDRKFFKGNIGLNDIRTCIEAAKEIPQDIDY